MSKYQDLKFVSNTTSQFKKTTKKAEKVELYLRGPIKLWWLSIAKEKSYTALLVGLVLWHYRSLMKSLEFSITFRKLMIPLSLSRQQVIRGIIDLEKVNLIKVKRKKGSKSSYVIVDKRE